MALVRDYLIIYGSGKDLPIGLESRFRSTMALEIQLAAEIVRYKMMSIANKCVTIA